ncbi:hypothetical protein [uncultured Chitinophaga sp.]|mgnify:CR=1 FL=1|jgi:hypothetical protein|uniref:hypothetical protein n=1 Tax=uncultured Chitinophaga sp. TaxID=339340 RepID=UPI00260E158E|nr:hypothetical protein [uncultured Chitinophaga sp.]
MYTLTDKHYSIAWFIRQCLENAFRQQDGKPAQHLQLNQELTKFTLKLPAFLYNAGYTPAIIAPDSIHIKQQGLIADISIDQVGQFRYDISTKQVHALNTVPDTKATLAIPDTKTRWQKRKHVLTFNF